MKKTTVLALLIVSGLVHAQSAPASATASTKKDLVARLLVLQQPAVEQMAQSMAEGPAIRLQQQAALALQTRVPPDKRDAVAKLVEADLKKYADDVVPTVKQQAVKLAPTTIGALLEEKFTEDELKQLIAIIESPVNKKFAQMNPEFQKALSEKLVASTQASVEPKVKALQQAMATHMGLPAAPTSKASDAAGAKAPAATGSPTAKGAKK